MKHKKVPSEFGWHLIFLYNVDLHPLFGDSASSPLQWGFTPCNVQSSQWCYFTQGLEVVLLKK